jgi:hypothetical protein
MAENVKTETEAYYDYLVDFAVKDAEEYGDFEQIIELLQQRNVAVLRNQKALDLITTRLRNKKRTKLKSKAVLIKRIKFGYLAWAYHGAGLPKWNDPSVSKKLSACRKVGKLVNASESLVRKGMTEVEGRPSLRFWIEFGEMLQVDGLDKTIENGVDIEKAVHDNIKNYLDHLG